MYLLSIVDMHVALQLHGYKNPKHIEYIRKQKNPKSNLAHTASIVMSPQYYRYQPDKADKKLALQLHMYQQNKLYIRKQYDRKNNLDYMENIV